MQIIRHWRHKNEKDPAHQAQRTHRIIRGCSSIPGEGSRIAHALPPKKGKKKKKKQKQYCNKFNKAFKKKLRCSRGKLSGCYKLLPSAFRGLWAFWELQRKGVLSVLFTGGSALSQDEGEGWYPCAEHPLCKQGLALHQSSHLALVGWSGNHDSRLPPPGGDKIFSRH